jgi:hypothetical protein
MALNQPPKMVAVMLAERRKRLDGRLTELVSYANILGNRDGFRFTAFKQAEALCSEQRLTAMMNSIYGTSNT